MSYYGNLGDGLTHLLVIGLVCIALVAIGAAYLFGVGIWWAIHHIVIHII